MTRPSATALGITLTVLCLIWGTTWAVIQVGLRGIPPFTGVALRFGLAGALLLAISLWRGVRLGRTPRERRLWVVNALLAFCGSYGIVYWSEQWVPSGLAAVLFATYPLFVTLLAHALLPGEPLRWVELVGVLIGFGGVGVIFSEDFAALGGSQVALAAVVMLGSPLVSAVASVAIKKWGSDIHTLSIAGVPMAMAAGLMGALALGFERERELTWDAVSISALLYLAIAGSAVTFTLYYWLLQHMPAKRLALIAYIVPVVAVGIGALRGEPLTLRMLLGAGFVVLGVALTVQRGELRLWRRRT